MWSVTSAQSWCGAVCVNSLWGAALATVFQLAPVTGAHGQARAITRLGVVAPCVPIDFESVPGAAPAEGLLISDQFKSTQGVEFRLEPTGIPVLAAVGRPMTAFSSRWGPDTPAPNQGIGTFFLTDDGRTAGLDAPPLIVAYDPPTSAACGVVLDIDFNETFTIEARDAAGAILQSVKIKAGDPNTGDGIATRWSIDRESADIHSIRFVGRRTALGGFGLGFDNFCSRSSASGALLKRWDITIGQLP